MPRIAKVYIALILVSGAAVLLVAAGSWSLVSFPQFLTLLGFAAVASTLKLRIPGVESTMSPNFVFLLLAMLVCSFSQLIAIALVCALVQSWWAAKNPRLVQVGFSAAALVLSAGAARESAYLLFGRDAAHTPVSFVILAGALYLALNTAIVSAVIGLADCKPLVQVGRVCCECVFPYFMTGIVFAGLVSSSFPRPPVWNTAVVLFLIVLLGYLYSKNSARTLAPAPIQPAFTEDEELVEVGSHGIRTRR
ncbi:MAG: hypothetical protein WB543_19050 [Candidatus Acidiferrum sp.]